MSGYESRFAAALGVFAFGAAGAASMIAGAGVGISLLRAAAAGAVFLVFGRLLAVIVFNGPISIPKPPPAPKKKEEKR